MPRAPSSSSRPPARSKTAAERKQERTMAALKLGVQLFTEMERAGALRLPFPGYPEAIAVLRAAVK